MYVIPRLAVLTFIKDVSIQANIKVKGKAIPLQAWTGPEDSRRLRPPDFKTLGT